jgi:hypothetical protein
MMKYMPLVFSFFALYLSVNLLSCSRDNSVREDSANPDDLSVQEYYEANGEYIGDIYAMAPQLVQDDKGGLYFFLIRSNIYQLDSDAISLEFPYERRTLPQQLELWSRAPNEAKWTVDTLGIIPFSPFFLLYRHSLVAEKDGRVWAQFKVTSDAEAQVFLREGQDWRLVWQAASNMDQLLCLGVDGTNVVARSEDGYWYHNELVVQKEGEDLVVIPVREEIPNDMVRCHWQEGVEELLIETGSSLYGVKNYFNEAKVMAYAWEGPASSWGIWNSKWQYTESKWFFEDISVKRVNRGFFDLSQDSLLIEQDDEKTELIQNLVEIDGGYSYWFYHTESEAVLIKQSIGERGTYYKLELGVDNEWKALATVVPNPSLPWSFFSWITTWQRDALGAYHHIYVYSGVLDDGEDGGIFDIWMKDGETHMDTLEYWSQQP